MRGTSVLDGIVIMVAIPMLDGEVMGGGDHGRLGRGVTKEAPAL